MEEKCHKHYTIIIVAAAASNYHEITHEQTCSPLHTA
jgi:hypothetical protein